MIEPAILTLAYILDLAIGDRKQIPHPVRIIGWLITKTEGLLRHVVQNAEDRTSSTEAREKLAGVFLVLIIVASTYGLFYVINSVLLGIEPACPVGRSYRITSHFSVLISYLSFILLACLISTTLATRELLKSAQSVLETLKTGSIESARENLSCIVGRDTKPLDRDEILKAAIESLAENASDGIIAPLFYLSIGGLPLAMAYKAINTLDSMVGYKNERYRDFGWAAAKLDDIANYIPARITGFLIVISTFIIGSLRWVKCLVQNSSSRRFGISGLSSFRIMLRDGKNHLSPNSGIPEAAMAGALGIRLGGPSVYEGIIIKKPYIGEERQGTSPPPLCFAKRSSRGTRGQAEHHEQSTDFYIGASERAITITKITSLLGFSGVLVLSYVRTAL